MSSLLEQIAAKWPNADVNVCRNPRLRQEAGGPPWEVNLIFDKIGVHYEDMDLTKVLQRVLDQEPLSDGSSKKVWP